MSVKTESLEVEHGVDLLTISAVLMAHGLTHTVQQQLKVIKLIGSPSNPGDYDVFILYPWTCQDVDSDVGWGFIIESHQTFGRYYYSGADLLDVVASIVLNGCVPRPVMLVRH